MHHRFAQSYFLFFMTSVTHLIARFFEQQLRYDAVSQVAVLTFFLLDNRVNIFHLEVFIGKFLVALQTFLSRKSFPLGGGGACR
jgi:hypothetical protein